MDMNTLLELIRQTTLWEWLTIIQLLLGAFFIFVAGLGLIRMPDVFLRMSATTKAATLGVGFVLLATVTYLPASANPPANSPGTISRIIATLVFVFLTGPVAAHMIARAAYKSDETELWEGTVDEWDTREG